MSGENIQYYNRLYNNEGERLVNHDFIKPIGCLGEKNYEPSDIEWVGTREVEVDPARFLELLKELPLGAIPPFESGFLGWKIVMKDGCWFEGDMDFEYGDNFWTYHEVPVRPAKTVELTCVEDIVGDFSDDDEYDDEE